MFLFRVEPVRDNHGDIFKWYGANTDIEDRKRAEALLAAEKRTLEMIASEACLADILERLCETIDAQAGNIKSAVMLMDADGMHLRHAAGPRVPKGWVEAIAPLKIGACIGSCGSAAFLKQRVIVSDIATDPLWGPSGGLAFVNERPADYLGLPKDHPRTTTSCTCLAEIQRRITTMTQGPEPTFTPIP